MLHTILYMNISKAGDLLSRRTINNVDLTADVISQVLNQVIDGDDKEFIITNIISQPTQSVNWTWTINDDDQLHIMTILDT